MRRRLVKSYLIRQHRVPSFSGMQRYRRPFLFSLEWLVPAWLTVRGDALTQKLSPTSNCAQGYFLLPLFSGIGIPFSIFGIPKSCSIAGDFCFFVIVNRMMSLDPPNPGTVPLGPRRIFAAFVGVSGMGMGSSHKGMNGGLCPETIADFHLVPRIFPYTSFADVTDFRCHHDRKLNVSTGIFNRAPPARAAPNQTRSPSAANKGSSSFS